MRHACEIDHDGFAADGFAKRQSEFHLAFAEIILRNKFAQIDGFAALVWKFNADRITPGHNGDTGGDGAHRTGNVIGQADNAGRFNARCGLKLVKRYNRAWPDIDDFAANTKIF